MTYREAAAEALSISRTFNELEADDLDADDWDEIRLGADKISAYADAMIGELRRMAAGKKTET